MKIQDIRIVKYMDTENYTVTIRKELQVLVEGVWKPVREVWAKKKGTKKSP